MTKLETNHASLEREQPLQIEISNGAFASDRLFSETLNAIPDVVLVLDQHRQIVHCNGQLLDLLGGPCLQHVLGRRPGEVFHCIHAEREEDGCGASIFCHQCGAAESIRKARAGEANAQECRMTIRQGQEEVALDLRVWAVPLQIQGSPYVILTIRDILDEKRREALERTFFHDILNDLGILLGYAQNLRDGFLCEDENPGEKMNAYVRRLADTVQAQRDLLAAESGRYEPKRESFSIYAFICDIADAAATSNWAEGVRIHFKCLDLSAEIETDRTVLHRILTNLIKNAVEATDPGGRILLQYQKRDLHEFTVHNDAVMSDAVKLQMFQRSFSTKGKGRGIGAYSVKLFAEKYLGGKVGFSSEAGRGTTFTVSLPR